MQRKQRCRIKRMRQQVKCQDDASPTSLYQSNRQEQDSVTDTEELTHEDGTHEERDDGVVGDNDIVLFSEEVDDGRDVDDHGIVANLDVKDGESNELDDKIEAEPDDCVPKK